MKKSITTKSIASAGILTALYAIASFLSVYNIVPFLSIFFLMIMPILAAYYASINSLKATLLFNIATMVVCFLISLTDPIYSILYVLPTLLIGDLFGLLNKLKIKYYTSIFLQSIAFSITNILAIVLAEKYYEISIIKFIISDEWVYNNLSFSILFILSGVEAIFTSIFVFERLKSINIIKEKERKFPMYGYIAILILTLLTILFYFISNNLYFLCLVMILILAIPIVDYFIKTIKHFSLVMLAYFLITIPLEIYMCSLSLFYLVGIIVISPLSIFCLVKVITYIYNITARR